MLLLKAVLCTMKTTKTYHNKYWVTVLFGQAPQHVTIATQVSSMLFIFRCLFTTSSVKLFVVNVQFFVYNCVFGKRKKTLTKPFTV